LFCYFVLRGKKKAKTNKKGINEPRKEYRSCFAVLYWIFVCRGTEKSCKRKMGCDWISRLFYTQYAFNEKVVKFNMTRKRVFYLTMSRYTRALMLNNTLDRDFCFKRSEDTLFKTFYEIISISWVRYIEKQKSP